MADDLDAAIAFLHRVDSITSYVVNRYAGDTPMPDDIKRELVLVSNECRRVIAQLRESEQSNIIEEE